MKTSNRDQVSPRSPQSQAVSSPPSFADFQFRTIGQQAKFLTRLSDPDSQDQHQHQHPSPSPSPRTGNHPSHSSSNTVFSSEARLRPTFLQALYDIDTTMPDRARPARKDLQSATTDNTIDPSNSNLSKTVDSRSRRRQSSSPHALATAVPLTSPREKPTLDSSLHNNHNESSLASGRSHVPTTTGYPYPTASQSTITFPRAQLGPVNAITTFQQSTLPQLQSRLRSSLTTLDALSLTSASPTASTLTVAPRSPPAKAIHNARKAAQVSVSQADASLHATQAAYTFAQKSVDSARRALELAQQSLTAAQAAHAAAEQSAADVQVSLSGAREARERADEAMFAISRVETALDAQEHDLATREARVRNVVVDTRAIVEVIDVWVAERDAERLKEGERRMKMWESQNRRVDEERRRVEKDGRRAAEIEADIARRAWRQAQINAALTNEDNQHQGVASQTQETVVLSNPLETQASIQPDQVQNQPTAEPLREGERLGIFGSQKAKETLTEQKQDPKEREDELRKTQEKKRQEVMMEKQRAAAAAAAKIIAERTKLVQTPAVGNVVATRAIVPPTSPSMSRVAKQTSAPGNRGNQSAVAGANGSLVSTCSSPSMALPTPPPVVRNSASTKQSQAFAKSTELVNSDSVLINKFIPATTEAGRLVQTDMPFSSIALASENGRNTTKEVNSANVNHNDDRMEEGASPQDASPPSRSSLGLRPNAPQDESHVSPPRSPTSIRACSNPNNARPVDWAQTPPPTWTVLKQEPSEDVSENEVETGAVTRRFSIDPNPATPSHTEQASNLRHLVNASGVTFKSNPGPTVKREPSMNDIVILPPQKESGADPTVNMMPGAQDSANSNPPFVPLQTQPTSRSISPAVSTGSNPIHSTQVSVPPPRMKKFNKTWAAARRNSINTNGTTSEKIATSQDSENARIISIVDTNETVNTSKSPDNDNVMGNAMHDATRDSSNGDEFDLVVRRSDERVSFDAGRSYVPDARRRKEYRVGDSNVIQMRPARGKDRPRGARGGQPSRFVRSPSPIARRRIDAQNTPIFMRYPPVHTGITPVPSSPPASIQVSRPGIYRRQRDYYSPTSPPQIYLSSSHLMSPPSPPQIIGKRTREENPSRVHSDSHPGGRSWFEDPEGRESRRARTWQGTSESSRIFGSTPPELTLASRMQEPAKVSSSVNLGQSDSRPGSSYDMSESQPKDSYPAPRLGDDHQLSNSRNLPNDREREYERERNVSSALPPSRREKRRESYGPDTRQKAEVEQQPHLLSRMSDQAGPPPRGTHNNRRIFDRGRGLSRARGGVSTRGSARSSTFHVRPLQDRIG